MGIGELQKQYVLKRTELLIYFANTDELNGFKRKLDVLNIRTNEVEISEFIVEFFKYNDLHIAIFLANKIGPQAAYNSLMIVGNQFPNLKYVVNLGCCANTEDEDKGCVIVADKIFDADLRKEKDSGTEYYGNENKHYKLTNKIRNTLRKIKDIKYEIKYKPLIASSALVNNKDYKEKLVETFPYAAGIEMEGLAISDYALSREIEWIVIKGTSDKGYDKKDHENQEEMALYASDLFFKIIEANGISKSRVNVFVSGGLHKTKKYKNLEEIQNNSMMLCEKLLSNNYRIVNGFGHIIGPSFLTSVYKYIRDHKAGDLKDYIELSPFPRGINYGDNVIREYFTQNREKMIEKCLVSIFIYGRNTSDNSYNGMSEEFNIASSKYVPRLVIPQSDFHSIKLFDNLKTNKFDGIQSTKYKEKAKELSNNQSFDKSIEIIIEMFKILDDFYYGLE